MNILMLASRFHPHVGGVEKHLWELLIELLARGHRCTVISERYNDNLPEEESISLPSGMVTVLRVARTCTPEASFISRKTCWPSLYRMKDLVSRADIVHCHDYGVFIYWYLPLRFLYPLKKPFVTFHGWEGIFPPQRKAIALRKMTEILTAGNICIGEFICKWYGTCADFINYGAVSANSVVPLCSNGGSIEAVFIGRLAQDTGIMMYLDALRILDNKNIHVALTVCGDGPLREECALFASMNSLDVRFTGFVDNPITEAPGASFAFVSGYLAILEAMYLRKLVFSVFDNPIKEDYLRMHPGSSDMMFIAGTSQELALQLELSFMDRELIDKMKNAAQVWASKQNWVKVADTYERLWGVIL